MKKTKKLLALLLSLAMILSFAAIPGMNAFAGGGGNDEPICFEREVDEVEDVYDDIYIDYSQKDDYIYEFSYQGNEGVDCWTFYSYNALDEMYYPLEAGELKDGADYEILRGDLSSRALTVQFCDEYAIILVSLTRNIFEYGLKGNIYSDMPVIENFNSNGIGTYYYFTPTENTTYYFYSTGSADTIGYLQYNEYEELATNDDYIYNNEDNRNFCIDYDCDAGHTYWLYVRHYDYYADDSYTVCVSKTAPADYHKHVFTETVLIPATCTTDGEMKYTCSCGEYFIETIEATGHKLTTFDVPATCTTDGYRRTACTVCGIYKDVVTSRATGHSPAAVAGKNATCTENGLTNGTSCSKCGAVLTPQQAIPATGHSWDGGKVTTEPTAMDKGVKTFTCQTCGATRTEEIEKYKATTANPVKVEAVKNVPAVKASALKKKDQTIAINKLVKVKKAKGRVTYAKKSGNKKITVDAKTGKLILKKGLKKGTYNVKVKVQDHGTKKFKAKATTVTVKVRVK